MTQLIVIAGPTASGKTDLAIGLAKHFHTEILSADSRQFYREMNIGTAKPGPDELIAISHHFINSLSIIDDYNVGNFETEALDLLHRLFRDADHVIMAGGSGLYIRAVCEGLDVFPDVPVELRNQLEKEYLEHGIERLQHELRLTDPGYYQQVDLNNPHRLIRALSVIRVSGIPFSTFRKQNRVPRDFQPVYILLEPEKEELYSRINQRVDQMMDKGLLEEASLLYPYRHLNALQTVGYTELFSYLDQKISLDEAVELIKQHSRNYAKRQLTWFRKDPHWQSFRPGMLTEIIEYINKQL